jgi:hypothetical protein
MNIGVYGARTFRETRITKPLPQSRVIRRRGDVGPAGEVIEQFVGKRGDQAVPGKVFPEKLDYVVSTMSRGIGSVSPPGSEWHERGSRSCDVEASDCRRTL